MLIKFLVTLALFIFSSFALALPIDWEGSFGVNTIRQGDYSHQTGGSVQSEGSQAPINTSGIPAGNTANFQTYFFKLNPSVIVNDSATLKAEFSTGYGRGGFLGDNSTNQQNAQSSATNGNANYLGSNSRASSALNVNQVYAELYTSAAKLRIGRFSRHFGKGLIYNGGSKDWDRFFTSYDGLDAEFKVGNLSVTPFWAKLNSRNTSGNIDQLRTGDQSEMGIALSYNNPDAETKIGINYSQRSSENNNGAFIHSNYTCMSGGSCTGTNQWYSGRTKMTIMDLYIEKNWKKAKFNIEIPMITGSLGNVYNSTTQSNIKARAIVSDFTYDFDLNWKVGLTAGQVSGDDGSSNAFEATYLHPNFQIANILFRYNLRGMSNSNVSVFDSSITNANFLKFNTQYFAESWDWNFAVIMATASQVAATGKQSYQHENGYTFTSNANQGKNYGTEVDFNLNYNWNPNVKVSFNSGLLFTGDYYSFANSSSTKIATKNTLLTSLGIILNF